MQDGGLTEVLAEAVAAGRPDGYLLFAGEDADTASRAVGGRRIVWSRRAGSPTEPQLWPSGGPFAGAALRLPRAREEIDMSLHALASVMTSGATLFVYGPNSEGIRSAADKLAPLFEDPETLLTKRHARVLKARRADTLPGLRPTLSDWRTEGVIGAAATPWVSYPGVFAGGRVDEGTMLLVRNLPPIGPQAACLDFGCGTGPLARAIHEVAQFAAIDMLDADIVALEAARENVPAARAMLGTGLSACGPARYDVIVSNPPIHRGSDLDFNVVQRLVSKAPQHLKPSGVLRLVVQQTVPVPLFAEGVFAGVDLVVEEQGYRIWNLSGAA